MFTRAQSDIGATTLNITTFRTTAVNITEKGGAWQYINNLVGVMLEP
jgi:hypothetical protein